MVVSGRFGKALFENFWAGRWEFEFGNIWENRGDKTSSDSWIFPKLKVFLSLDIWIFSMGKYKHTQPLTSPLRLEYWDFSARPRWRFPLQCPGCISAKASFCLKNNLSPPLLPPNLLPLPNLPFLPISAFPGAPTNPAADRASGNKTQLTFQDCRGTAGI